MIFPVLAQESPSGTKPVSCKQESDCLEKLSGRARRDGDTLSLRLEGGKTKIFKTDRKACENDDAERCVVYELRAYRPGQHVYVVGWTLYEGEGAGLVDIKTGDVFVLPSVPVFSPSGLRFTATDNDFHGDPEFRVGIWSLEGGKAKQEFRYSSADKMAVEVWNVVNWDGETRIRFEVGFEDASRAPAEADAILKAQGWLLNWPAAKAR